MKYAIIETGGKQYKVSEGLKLNIEYLKDQDNKPVEIDKVFDFEKVLLEFEDDKLKLGKPYIDTKVTAKILEHTKSKKVISAKFKAKTGYSKKIGHRQNISTIKILKIKDK